MHKAILDSPALASPASSAWTKEVAQATRRRSADFKKLFILDRQSLRNFKDYIDALCKLRVGKPQRLVP
jgi:hypothetical protein